MCVREGQHQGLARLTPGFPYTYSQHTYIHKCILTSSRNTSTRASLARLLAFGLECIHILAYIRIYINAFSPHQRISAPGPRLLQTWLLIQLLALALAPRLLLLLLYAFVELSWQVPMLHTHMYICMYVFMHACIVVALALAPRLLLLYAFAELSWQVPMLHTCVCLCVYT